MDGLNPDSEAGTRQPVVEREDRIRSILINRDEIIPAQRRMVLTKRRAAAILVFGLTACGMVGFGSDTNLKSLREPGPAVPPSSEFGKIPLYFIPQPQTSDAGVLFFHKDGRIDALAGSGWNDLRRERRGGDERRDPLDFSRELFSIPHGSR